VAIRGGGVGTAGLQDGWKPAGGFHAQDIVAVWWLYEFVN